jgi:hypothetical protein
VIGLQISRNGDGNQAERRPIEDGCMLFYTIGRSYLLELFHAELQSSLVKFVDGPMARRAYEQLMRLDIEMHETGIVYSWPSGRTTISASPAPCWRGRHGIHT